MKSKKCVRIILLIMGVLFVTGTLYAAPFFGGFYLTENVFDNDNFTTDNRVSFYVDHKFNDNASFYTRMTGGMKFFVNYTDYKSTDLRNFAFIPNIDLLYFELRSGQHDSDEMKGEKYSGETNFDLFRFRIGRTHITFDSGFIFNMKGDGVEALFTIKNFSFSIFGVTNSFDYLPLFDFIDGGSKPTFTRWDQKRLPSLLTGVQGDPTINGDDNQAYNFYFTDASGYSSSERARLTTLRNQSVVAGRIFSGFSFKLRQMLYQNFSMNFLANVDLIPEDFVQVYPDDVSQVTFGGRYTSFYASFNANGKIIRNLYYNFEAVYETGYTATHETNKRFFYEAIHSFALNTKFSYFFEHVTSPTVHVEFLYAHGDADAQFNNNIYTNGISNKFDFMYQGVNQPVIGYAVQPDFSNLVVLKFSQTIKPLAFLQKKSIFSRFSVESVVLIFMRPIIEGPSFLAEKPGLKSTLPEKAYLGVEFDLLLDWVIFSDFKVQLNGGIFVPNGTINEKGYTPMGRVGLSCNISF